MTTAEALAEARTARHSLLVGSAVRVVVDRNGERVEFSRASLAQLDRYIYDLEQLLAAEAGTALPRGPMGVIF